MLAAGVLPRRGPEEVDVVALRVRCRRPRSEASPQPVDTGVDSRRPDGQGLWAGDDLGGRSRPGSSIVVSEGTA